MAPTTAAPTTINAFPVPHLRLAMHALQSAAPFALSHDPAVEARTGAATATPPSGGGPDAMPAELGGVRLRHLLGQGGMGRVYLGRHLALDRDVAVKVMRDRLSGDSARFLAEARLAARIDHGNIVRILHAGDEQGRLYLVMEYVAGRNLKRIIQDRQRLPWREALGFVLQAARGLGAAHQAGIVHRDVKPSNMLVTPDGRLKVADLGVARSLGDDPLGTTTGNIVGTPAYMAPEQAKDPRHCLPTADVYALGASLYHLLAGEVPFFRLSFAGVLLAHQREPLPDIRQQVPDLPPAVVSLLTRLMAKDPSRRPTNGDAVAAELERILGLATVSTTAIGGTTIPTPHAADDGSHWRVAAAAVLFAGVALTAWTIIDRRPAAGAPGIIQPAPAPDVPGAAALAHVPAADPWQTPARAVFVISERLPATTLAGIDEACRASGLTVVERQRIDTLVREQDLASDGRADPATVGRIGRLVGGHIALFVNAVDDRTEVRTVLVETGEVVASRLVAPADTAAAITAGITSAAALLPVQGRVTATQDGRLLVSAGSRHGLRVGDRLDLRQADAVAVLTTATVTAIERDRAVITVAPARPDCAGMTAHRILP